MVEEKGLTEVRDEVFDLRRLIKEQVDARLYSLSQQINRTTNTTAAIVPILQREVNGTAVQIPSDRYYQVFAGTVVSSTGLVSPAGTISTAFDTTELQGYNRLGDGAGAAGWFLGPHAFHYGGVGGMATSYAPKNPTATTLRLQFKARFNGNVDYNDRGIGLTDGGGGLLFVAGVDFIQVLRNGAAWELGSGDGTNASQTSGGTGDAAWHEFRVEWKSTGLVLYVDDVSTITKTTNLPVDLLYFLALSPLVNTIDIIDFLVDWV